MFGGSGIDRRNALPKNGQNTVVLGSTQCFAAVWPSVWFKHQLKKIVMVFLPRKTPENSTKKTENRDLSETRNDDDDDVFTF